MKYTVDVTQTLEIEVEESAFTKEFMAEFRDSFYPFTTIEEHVAHIAQLQARGLVDLSFGKQFIEGYGLASDFGMSAKVTYQEETAKKVTK